MNPKYHILLYSDYSNECKEFLQASSGMNLPFQYLKVDNPEVRKRILGNSELGVCMVPCLICVYPNGTVEKYEGDQAFLWLSEVIRQNTPPPPEPEEIKQVPVQRVDPPRASASQKTVAKKPINRLPQNTPLVALPEEDEIEFMEPLSGPDFSTESPMEDPQDAPEEERPHDRHVKLPFPKRIREDDKGYVEDEALFPGEPVDHRKEPSNTVKRKASSMPERDISGAVARAKQLEKERAGIESADATRMGRKPMNPRTT